MDSQTSTTTAAQALRALADLIGDDLPASALAGVYVREAFTSDGREPVREAFARLSVRPDAAITVAHEQWGHVKVAIPDAAAISFPKRSVGTERTVTREVVEYEIDVPAVSS